MSKIEHIDKNFKIQSVEEDGLIYRDCMQEPFSLHGFSNPCETGVFSRLPRLFAEHEDVNEGVRSLMFHTSGGRVRFRTDSQVIAIKVELGEICSMDHMPNTGIRDRKSVV